MADSVASDPRVGTELAGYRIVAVLGRGGMGVVYLAEDQALGRKVALKLLAEELAGDRRFHERFRLESRLAASIDHPNVIPIYEAGEAGGQLFIAMRYVEGSDLRTVLDQQGPLEAGRAVRVVGQVAEGLDAAHARGLVHRDVKPSNILIAAPGDREHVYLADFGLTRTASADDDEARVAGLSGTPDYVAPEQITEGVADVAADVYSLGCVLYESLTARVPYPRKSEFETLWAHVEDVAPKPSDVGPELAESFDVIVARAMAKDPGNRFASAGELAAALRGALPRTGRSARRAVVTAAVAAAVVTAAVLVAALSGGGGGERSPTAPTLALTGGALQRVDPDRMKLAATIKVRGEPIDVAAGPAGVWLVGGAGPSFHRIDPRTNAIVRGPAIPGIEAGIAAGQNSVWMASHGTQGQGILMQLGAQQSSPARRFDLRELAGQGSGSRRSHLSSLAAVLSDPAGRGPGFAGWVVDAAEGGLRHVRTGSRAGRVVAVETGGIPLDLAVWQETLWAVQKGEVIALRIDRLAGGADVMSRARVPGTPISVAADERGAWVATREGRLIHVSPGRGVRVNLKVNQGLPPYVAQGHPTDVALRAGSLWVLLDDGTLDRRDQRTGRSLGTVDVGRNAVALTVTHRAVWVAVRGGDRLRRLPRGYISLAGPELTPGKPIPGCRPGRSECVHELGLEFESRDGTSALVEAAFVERRVTGGSVRCGGRTHHGPATADVRDPGAARIRIARWGIVTLRLQRLVSVAATPDVSASTPVCGLISGTWLGTSGPVKGAGGRFTWTPGAQQRIVLR